MGGKGGSGPDFLRGRAGGAGRGSEAAPPFPPLSSSPAVVPASPVAPSPFMVRASAVPPPPAVVRAAAPLLRRQLGPRGSRGATTWSLRGRRHLCWGQPTPRGGLGGRCHVTGGPWGAAAGVWRQGREAGPAEGGKGPIVCAGPRAGADRAPRSLPSNHQHQTEGPGPAPVGWAPLIQALVLLLHPGGQLVRWNGWPVVTVNEKNIRFSFCRMEEELAAPSTSTDKTDRWDGSWNCQLWNNTKSWSYYVKCKDHPSCCFLDFEFNSHVWCRCWKLVLTSGLHTSSASRPFQGLIRTKIPAVLEVSGFLISAGEAAGMWETVFLCGQLLLTQSEMLGWTFWKSAVEDALNWDWHLHLLFFSDALCCAMKRFNLSLFFFLI